ncbi:MAG: M20/M25/M40 family metallo-hydrolase [Blastocatellia bacterium]|nr:M20/M25/M40 family metallo-hydrolase [Blastocatellia bacterium]
MNHPAFLTPDEERVLARVDEMAEEMFDFLARVIRIPTVNPPGENYAECAALVQEQLMSFGYEVVRLTAVESPAHSACYPRVNVVGRFARCGPGRTVHLSARVDVVPPGTGWTVEPFGGLIRERKIFGRGAADAKAGLAMNLYAVEALRRAHVAFDGVLEVSATVDGESGGEAGMGYLVDAGIVRAGQTDHVLIAAACGVERLRFAPRHEPSRGRFVEAPVERSAPVLLSASEAPMEMRLVRAMDRAIRCVLVRPPECVVGPATSECAHVERSGVREYLLYGPGRFELARQPDEYCRLEDVVAGCKVLALALLRTLREDADDSPTRSFRTEASH